MCRRWSGSFYPALRAQRFTLEGEESVSIYRSSPWAERAFCTTCGSNLWFRFLPTGSRSFVAGLFDLQPGFTIDREIFIDEKPGWYELEGDRPKVTRNEVWEEAEKEGFTFD